MAISATAGSVSYAPPEVVAIEDNSQMGGSGSWLIPLVIVAVLVLALTQQEEEIAISDARLKTNIAPTGIAPNGLPLYSFSYVGSTQVFEGVMAQDVFSHTPEAVFIGPFGYMAVDYGMLGLEMARLD